MSTRLEDEVREALRRTTESLPMPSDPYARVMGAVETHRRRRRAAIAGAALVAVLLAGVVGVSTGIIDVDQRASTPATERLVDRAPDWGFQGDWPARGQLGTEAEFAEEFGRLYGTDHRLLYAEDGEAGRVVIAISADQEAVLFIGRKDADLTELQRIPGRQITTRDVAVAVPQDGGHLVIAAMPEHLIDAQLSIPAVARDGSVGRTWQEMPVADGIARAVTADPIGVVRVRTPVGDGPLHIVVGGAQPGLLDCEECDPDWFADEGVTQFRDQVAAVVGAPAGDVAARVLLDTSIEDARVAVLVATLPSGGLVRGTYLVTREQGASALTMVEPLRPLPSGDESRPVFVSRDTVPGIAEALLIAPDASRIMFTALAGSDAPTLDAPSLTDGVAMMSTAPGDLGGYRVSAYSSDGTVLRTWHGSALRPTDPFLLSPAGWPGRIG